jgi:hypothetical protein
VGFVLWLLVTYGLANAISSARVGAPLRRRFPITKKDGPGEDDQAVSFAHLIRCPKCVGAWIGAALTFLNLGPAMVVTLPIPGVLVVQVALNGCAAAGWCWIVFVVLAKMGAEQL